jgi:hypothetical protein
MHLPCCPAVSVFHGTLLTAILKIATLLPCCLSFVAAYFCCAYFGGTPLNVFRTSLYFNTASTTNREQKEAYTLFPSSTSCFAFSFSLANCSWWHHFGLLPLCGLVGPLSSCDLIGILPKWYCLPLCFTTLTYKQKQKLHFSRVGFVLSWFMWDTCWYYWFSLARHSVDSVRRCCVFSVYDTIYRSEQTFTTQFTQIFRISGKLVQYSTMTLQRWYAGSTLEAP